jgi:hypothetical protein
MALRLTSLFVVAAASCTSSNKNLGKDGMTPQDASASADFAQDGGKTDLSDNTDAAMEPDAAMSCPATAPTTGSTCTDVGQRCGDTTHQCDCAANLKWECRACPATEPTSGGMCTGMAAAGACVYGADDCVCVMGKWSCGMCPATTPTNASTCTAVDIDCSYGATTCVCTAGATPAATPKWRCDASCPATQPSPGATCSTAATEQCKYGATTCVCVQGQFFCN